MAYLNVRCFARWSMTYCLSASIFGLGAVACGATDETLDREDAERLLLRSLAQEGMLKGVSGELSVETSVDGQQISDPLRVNFWLGKENEYVVSDSISRESLRNGVLTIEYYGDYVLVFDASIGDSMETYAWDWAVGSSLFVEDLLHPLGREGPRGLGSIMRNFDFQGKKKVQADLLVLLGTPTRIGDRTSSTPKVRISLCADGDLSLVQLMTEQNGYVVQEQWEEHKVLANGNIVPTCYESEMRFDAETLSGQTPQKLVADKIKVLRMDIAKTRPASSQTFDLPVYDLRKWGRTWALNALESFEETLAGVDGFIGAPEGSTILELAYFAPALCAVVVLVVITALFAVLVRKLRRGS